MKILPILLSILLSANLLSASSYNHAMSILNGHQKHKKTRKKVAKTYSKRTKKTTHKKRSRYHKKRHKTKRRKHGVKKRKTYQHNNEVTRFVDPKKYSKHKLTNKPYLELKSIDGPLPQDYANLYIKSKTLLPITKPHIKIVVKKSTQRIYVYRDLEHMYTFRSSTGKRGHRTPSGVFHPYSAEEMHYSRKYHNSPMPWSVFFYGGIAIHGTNAIHRLGHAASHGCVRTHPSSAKRIYKLVRKYGMRNTTVIVR